MSKKVIFMTIDFKHRNSFINLLCLSIIFIGETLFINNWTDSISKKPAAPTAVLQATTPGTNSVRFYYDAGGQRIAKIDPSSTGVNTYYISPELEITIDKAGRVNWRKNYYFGGKAVAVKSSEVIPVLSATSEIEEATDSANLRSE